MTPQTHPDSGDGQLVKRGQVLIVESNLPQVKVMAVADGWAMVRRPRCVPFVIQVRHLISLNRLTQEREKL